MSIHTGMGDLGDTVGPGGETVRKCHPAIQVVGALDELSSQIGCCLALAGGLSREMERALGAVQGTLLGLGAQIALPKTSPLLSWADLAQRLEREIDAASSLLPPLSSFILPRGCELACRLHVARTVCRRAERGLVGAMDVGVAMPDGALVYINRLGDLLFVLARRANQAAKIPDARWDDQAGRK